MKNFGIKSEIYLGQNKNSDDYDGKYMKITFNSDDKLPLTKRIEISTLTIVVGAVFHEKNEYYPQVFRDECLYKI